MYPFSIAPQTDRLASMPDQQQTHWLVGALVYERQRGRDRCLILPCWFPRRALLGDTTNNSSWPLVNTFPYNAISFLRHISPAIGALTPGTGGLVTLPNGVQIGTLICYEDILHR